MLAITIAVLGGVGLISLGTLRSANALLLAGSQDAANSAGVLVTVVGTQSNSTGTYVWLFNYGWEQGKLTSIFVDGGLASGWTSSCATLRPEEMCDVNLGFAVRGLVAIDFGDKTVNLSV